MLSKWKGWDARSITGREVIERLDEIADCGSPIMANATAAVPDLMLEFGVDRGIVATSPVQFLFRQ
jgi:hypothetical protein